MHLFVVYFAPFVWLYLLKPTPTSTYPDIRNHKFPKCVLLSVNEMVAVSVRVHYFVSGCWTLFRKLVLTSNNLPTYLPTKPSINLPHSCRQTYIHIYMSVSMYAYLYFRKYLLMHTLTFRQTTEIIKFLTKLQICLQFSKKIEFENLNTMTIKQCAIEIK